MSTKIIGKRRCKSALVTQTELVKNFESFENTEVNPSKEFFSLCMLSYIFSSQRNTFDKNRARKLETEMQKLCRKVLNSDNAEIDNIVTLAQMYYNVSEVYVDSNIKKKQIATDNILHCLNLIKDKELNRKTILLALDAHNLLGYIYYKQKKTEKAIQTFDKAVELYLTYIERKDEYGTPIDIKKIIFKSTEELNGFTKLTNTYLAILHTLTNLHTVMGTINKHKLIICTHMLLAAEFSKLSAAEEYVNWIKTALSLCDHFLMFRRFTEARNHLIVADFVKKHFIDEKYYNIVNKQNSLLKGLISYEQYKAASMLVTIHWVKYGITLLRISATRLQCLEEEDHNYERSYLESECPISPQKHTLQKLLLFTEIQKEFSITDKYALFKDKYLSDYNAAKEVFLLIIRILNDMIIHDRPNNDLIAYTTIVLYICNTYKYMALYEQDATSQATLHNRRIKILSDAIRGISKSNRNVLKYLRLQLAVSYSALIDMKLEDVEEFPYISQRYDTIIIEVNDLVAKSLMNLQKYMRHE